MTNSPAAGQEPEMLFEKLQLENELEYVREQLLQINAGTAAPGEQREILEAQQSRLLKWSAWLSDHFYRVPITPIGKQEHYDPSAALRHFWIGFCYEKTHVPFNMVTTYSLEEFNPEAFGRTCEEMTRRHEILRTVALFYEHSQTVKQKVLPLPVAGPAVTLMDISGESDKDEILKRHDDAARKYIFNYAQGPLFYFAVFKYDASQYKVLFNISHAIFDGWSKEVFEEEFAAIYLAYCQQRPHGLQDLSVQYKEYCAWEINYQRTDLAGGYAEYWYSQSSDRYPAGNLVTHFSNEPLADFSYRRSLRQRIAPYLKDTSDNTLDAFYGVVAKAERTQAVSYRFPVAGDTFTRLNAFCAERSVSPYHVIVAVLNVLLYKTNGVRDIVLGASAAIRDRKEIQKLIGFFVNTVLIRNCVTEEKTFSNLVTNVVISTALAAFYKSYTMSKVLDELDIPFNAVNTLFLNVMPSSVESALTDLSRRHYDTRVPGYFSIDVTVKRYDDGFEFWCNYDFTIYSKEDITGLFNGFEHILEVCLRHPHLTVDAITMQ